jgi:hypothetical protein
MNRSRIAFAIIAIAAIVFLSLAPAAEARPLRSKPAVSESWLDAAMVWLGSLLPGQGETTRTTENSKATGGNVKPIVIDPQYTGSCIDPNGCTWGG